MTWAEAVGEATREMALPVSKREARAPGKLLDAEAAQSLANGFLIDYVGDLLGAESPQLSEDGRWVMDITLGNVVQGHLGTVGSIAVDARTGEILYSEEDDAQVRARAEELSRAPVP